MTLIAVCKRQRGQIFSRWDGVVDGMHFHWIKMRSDGDGVGNNADNDDDNDGQLDADDESVGCVSLG